MGKVERLLLAGCTLVALGFGAYTITEKLAPGDDDVAVDSPSRSTTSTSFENTLAGREYEPGDCVDWDQTDSFAVTHVVGCREAHLMEIVGERRVGRDDKTYPSDEEWATIIDAECKTLGILWLDGKLDPGGAFVVGASAATRSRPRRNGI